MTGEEKLKAGDQLQCTSNTGLLSIGDITTIWGINETSINTSGGYTSWSSKNNFRWECFRFYKRPEEVPNEILEFNKNVELIKQNNKLLLDKRKKELYKQTSKKQPKK
ncbi:hypothetical protein [Tenacibaculum sp. 190524A02b]|uniref:hypothetical protein n=1 Tax=Tenacibaculum vairaonense TaxID=3137860 RepID=UPI0032B2A70E